MQQEDIIEGRDDAGGGYYKQEGWCRKEGIIEGVKNTEVGHYREEGCRN